MFSGMPKNFIGEVLPKTAIAYLEAYWHVNKLKN